IHFPEFLCALRLLQENLSFLSGHYGCSPAFPPARHCILAKAGGRSLKRRLFYFYIWPSIFPARGITCSSKKKTAAGKPSHEPYRRLLWADFWQPVSQELIPLSCL